MKSLNKLFLWVWIFSLFVWAVSLPPFFLPDESIHWTWVSRLSSTNPQRIEVSECSRLEKIIHAFPFQEKYNQAQGNIPRTGPLPIENIKPEDCKRVHASGAYSFLGFYFPAAISFFVFNDWGTIVLATRLINALFLSLLIFLVWRKLTRLPDKNSLATFCAFTLVGCFPLSLQQSVGLSMDFWPIAGCLGILGLSCFTLFNRIELALFVFAVGMASFVKPVFLPLIGLIFMFQSSQQFRSQKGKWVLAGIALVILVVGIRALLFLTSHHFVTANASSSSTDETLIPSMDFILNNPVSSFFTVALGSWGKISQLPGTRLGALNWPLSKIHSILGHLSLILFLVSLNWKNFSFVFRKFKFSVFFLFSFVFLTGLSLYIGNTPAGSSTISGLQTRYFIPFWFGLLFVLGQMGFNPKFSKLNIVLAALGLCLLSNASVTAFQIFWAFR